MKAKILIVLIAVSFLVGMFAYPLNAQAEDIRAALEKTFTYNEESKIIRVDEYEDGERVKTYSCDDDGMYAGVVDWKEGTFAPIKDGKVGKKGPLTNVHYYGLSQPPSLRGILR